MSTRLAWSWELPAAVELDERASDLRARVQERNKSAAANAQRAFAYALLYACSLDPFAMSEDSDFPVTLADFIRLYEHAARSAETAA